MKDIRAAEEKLNLLEKELATLAEKQDKLRELAGEIEDLKLELRAFKLVLGKHDPDFGTELQKALKKLKTG